MDPEKKMQKSNVKKMNKPGKKRPKKYPIDEKKLNDIIKELKAEDLNDVKTVFDIVKELEKEGEFFTIDKDAERALLQIAYDLLDETVKGINMIASPTKTKSKDIKGVDALLFLAHQCELTPKFFAKQYHGDIKLFMESLKTKKPLSELKKQKAATRQPVKQLAPKTNTKSLSEQSADEKLVNLILNGTRLDSHILQQSKNVRLPFGIDRNYLGEFSGYAIKKNSIPAHITHFQNAASHNQPLIQPLEVRQTPYLPGYIKSGAELLLNTLKPFTPGTEPIQDGTTFTPGTEPIQDGTTFTPGTEPIQYGATFAPGTEPIQDEANGFRASTSTFQSGTGLFQHGLESYYIQQNKDQWREFQLAQEAQKGAEQNIYMRNESEGEEFDQDAEYVQSDQLRQKIQLPQILQLSPELLQYLYQKQHCFEQSQTNFEFESNDSDESDLEQLDKIDEEWQDKLLQPELMAWELEHQNKNLKQKETIVNDSGDMQFQDSEICDFGRESYPCIQPIEIDIQPLLTDMEPCGLDIQPLLADMESGELDIQLDQPDILNCTMHSINSQDDLDFVPETSEPSEVLINLIDVEHRLKEQLLVQPCIKEPKIVDLTQFSDESKEDNEPEEANEQSDVVMEDQNNAVIEQQNNAVVEQQNNAVVEEQYNAVVEEQYNTVVEEQYNEVVEEQYNAVVEEQYNAVVKEQYNAGVKQQYNAGVEEQYNVVTEEQNTAVREEQNNAVENYFTKENSLEEIEFVSQTLEEQQMFDKNLSEKNNNLYEEKEDEIEVITIESSPERERLVEDEIPPKYNDEPLQIIERPNLIEMPPQSTSQPEPIIVSIDQDYLTSLDTPQLTKSFEKLPSKRSAGRPPLKKRTSRKACNRTQNKSMHKVVIDEPIYEINTEESSKRPPIKLSIKGIHGNSPCTVEINEPLQKKITDSKLVQNSDTFKSLQNVDERPKNDEFLMPSTSSASSGKVSSEYNWDFSSDNELTDKKPMGRKLRKKRKKISHQTEDEQALIVEPKKRKISSNMLAHEQKPNENSSRETENFSSKIPSEPVVHHKHHTTSERHQKSSKNKSSKSSSKGHSRKLISSDQSFEPKNKKHSSFSSSQQAYASSSEVLPTDPSSHFYQTDSSLAEGLLATSSQAACDLSVPRKYRKYYGKKGIKFKILRLDLYGLD